MTAEEAFASPTRVAVPKPTPPRRRRRWLRFVRDFVVLIAIALLVSFVVKTFVVRAFYIPSGSMENTLQIKDRILVDEITPRFGTYERGDVIVFLDPGGWLDSTPTTAPQPWIVEAGNGFLSVVGLSPSDTDDHLIKRVIGLPGDHVVCCNALGQTTVNGIPLDETPYLKLPQGQPAPKDVPYDVTVPSDQLWVLGDNRDHSRDSRFNQADPGRGFVPITNVVGRAFLVTWPFTRFGSIDFHHDVFDGVDDQTP